MPFFTLRAVLAVAVASLLAVPAHAQEWPAGPIRIVVGSAAGGGADTVARLISKTLSPALKVPVVVENKPGATGTIAADAVAKASDGHTLLLGTAGMQVIVPHLRKLPYDHTKDLVPIAMLASVPHVLVVSDKLDAKSVTELIAMAKDEPSKLNYASSGSGSAQQIAAELFQEATGISITHVPYKGSSKAMMDIISGQVQMNFDTLSSALPFIKRGQVRALAIMAPHRNSKIPEVPTMAEAGVKGMEMSAWYGIYAPSNTPKAVQERLHSELNKVLVLPEVKNLLDTVGVEPMPITQAQFAAFHAEEDKRFGMLIKQRGLKPD